MYAVSPQFLAALSRPHVLARRVDAYQGSTLLMGRLPISAGSITVDRGSKVWRTLSLEVSDVALLPKTPTDPLAVYGQTLRVYRGIQFQDGTEELCPVGVFRIQSPGGDRDLGPVKVTGVSLEAVVADEPFLTPFSTASYTSSADVVAALIHGAIPDATVVDETAVDPAPATTTWAGTDNRWDAVTDVALAMGADAFCDPAGVFRIRTIPDLATATPVWEVAAGEGGVLVSASAGMSRDKVKNGWLVSSGNASDGVPPVSALVVDSDPLSPTRWGGPMGHLLGRRDNPLWTSPGTCSVIGQALLRNSLGTNTSLSLRSVPNAALEAGDCIRVRHADGTPELHLVQTINLPLTASGDFTLTTFSRQET